MNWNSCKTVLTPIHPNELETERRYTTFVGVEEYGSAYGNLLAFLTWPLFFYVIFLLPIFAIDLVFRKPF
jgi:hypothetical protein